MFENFEGTGLRRWLLGTGIPFMLMQDNGKYKANGTRLIELFIMAGVTSIVTALLTASITMAKLEVKIDYAKEERARIEQRVERNEAYMMDLMKQIARNKDK